MEILYRGTPPENRVHEATCSRCKTQVRFHAHEAETLQSGRNEQLLAVTCPVCGYVITKEL